MVWRSVLKGVSFALPVSLTAWNLVGHVARVDGSSMQPVLNPSQQTYCDYVFLNCWAVHTLQLQRGEIVSLISPKNPDRIFIKRIVGLEGDTVKTLKYKKKRVTIPTGHCWVEGDNSRSSEDSNRFGPIPLALVQGKATHIIWPPWRWQKLPRQEPNSSRVKQQTSNSIKDMMSSI